MTRLNDTLSRPKNGFVKKRRSLLSLILMGLIVASSVSVSVSTQSPTRADATPGDVGTGLQLWLKANTGTSCTTALCTVSSWTDQSGQGKNGTASGTPDFALTGLNFNPTIGFGTGDYYSLPSGFADFTSGLSSFLVVSNTSSNGDPSDFNGFWEFSNGLWVDGIGMKQIRSDETPIMQLTGDDGSGTQYSSFAADGSFPLGEPKLISYTMAGGTPDVTYNTPYWGVDGLQVTGMAARVPPNRTRSLNRVGTAHQNLYNNNCFCDIAEIAVYNSNLSTSNRRKVESYLALKYGITLSQSTPQNYVATSNANSWSQSTGGTFNRDIAGIGRDDNTQLNQKQSRSINTDDLLTVGLGTIATSNVLNTNTFATDLSYLTWGNNNGGTATWTTTGAPTGLEILRRKYMLQENLGDTGNVVISVPDDSSSATAKLPTENNKVWALFDADGDFTSGSVRTQMTLNGTNWETTLNVDPSTMPYLGFATGNVLEAQFESATYTSVDETTNVTMRVAVQGGDLTGEGDQTIDIDVIGGTATGGGQDYTFTSPLTLTIPEDDYTTVHYFDVVVTLNGDLYGEGDETIEFEISNPTSQIAVGTIDQTILTITDDEAVGFQVAQTSASTDTTEDGQTDTFTIVLTSKPYNGGTTVGLTITPDADSDIGAGFGQPVDVTFDDTNWDEPQSFTVTGLNNHIIDVSNPRVSNIAVSIDTAVTTDSDYDAISSGLVENNITDNDIDTDGDGIVDEIDEDDDGDGVADEIENLAPNGDGNGDGIKDSLQSDVTTVANPVTDSYTTVKVDGQCDFINGYEVVAESSLSLQDEKYEYPVGLNDFTLECDNPGESATVTFYYDHVFDVSKWMMRKFDTTMFASLENSTIGTADVLGTLVTTISYPLTDGEFLDEDGDANGIIEDPAGPGVFIPDEVSFIPAPANGSLVDTGIKVFLSIQVAFGLIFVGLILVASKRRRIV